MKIQELCGIAALLLLVAPVRAAFAGPGQASEPSQATQGSGPQDSGHAGHNHGPASESAHDHGSHDHPRRDYVYTERILELAGSLPVQDGGRIKPLSTLAGFRLLSLNGKRTLDVEGLAPEEKLDPVAWLLDLILFPQHSDHYECFRVDNSDVLTAIGLPVKETRRGVYSYEALAPGIPELRKKVGVAANKEANKRGLLDRQYLNLWSDLTAYSDLVRALAFARVQLPMRVTPELAEIYAEEVPGLVAALRESERLRQAMDTSEGSEAVMPYMGLVRALSTEMDRARGGLGLFAPAVGVDGKAEWLDVGQVIDASFALDAEGPALVEALGQFEALEGAKQDPATLTAALEQLHGTLTGRAEARGEYAKIPMERSFYAVDYFYKALIAFGLAFLMTCLGWLMPKRRWIGWAILVPTLLAEGLVISGIVIRCILRSRPPVSTLYETILFITATGVLVALIAEWINRKRMALSVAVVMGLLGMFLAGKYELREAATAGDTMPSLVAVLDTNFWLATHVTSITLGYAAGLLASAMGHAWLVLWMAGKKRSAPKLMRDLLRMMYGVLCFALLFSVVGTILGGVWANDSWGRFWGWDPKENGALLICLSQLTILHARLGGLLRELGLVLATIAGGMVVAFSWWHVNLLGVGLHSYGFTDGALGVLKAFYLFELAVIAIAIVGNFLASRPRGGGLAGA